MSNSYVFSVRQAAELELREERRRIAIDAEKVRLRQYKPFWHKVFPFKVSITRR